MRLSVGYPVAVALVALALVGAVFFTVRLVADPQGWPAAAGGLLACLFLGLRHAAVLRANRRVGVSPALRRITDDAVLEEALASPQAVFFKRSPTCPVSADILDEVLRFARRHPAWPVYAVDVVAHRSLSQAIASRLGVAHASPQALAVRAGRCVGHADHYEITARALEKLVG